MASLAAAITSIHSEVTGADGFFAQVLFETLEARACFLAGRRLEAPHCFIHGHIRAGRSSVDRARLVECILDAAATVLKLPADAVWVYISELPPRAMAEYGALLPEPGDEAEWLRALPEVTRRRLQALGAP